MSKRAGLCGVLFLFLAAGVYGREGFGFTKKAVEMNKTVPPAINVPGSRVTVAVDSERTRVAGKAETLRKYTEDKVLAGNKQLQSVPNGDIHVVLTLDRLDADQRSQSKVEDNYVKEKDKSGKSTYVNHPTTKNFTTSSGEIGGTYKITDARGRMYETGDIDRKWTYDYDYTPPSNDKVQDLLMLGAAEKVAGRIVPTQSKVKVLMPKGSFEQYIPLAESGSWDQYRQAVEGVRPMNDRASDAFREYALGIAYEGLAYGATDAKQGLEYIRKSAEHYHTAATNNPDEKLFSEKYTSFLSASSSPIDRVEASLKAYETWASGPATPMASTASASVSKPSAARKSIRNQNIIDMTKAGLSDDNIIMAIDSADSREFDTTPDGLIALSKAGVSKNVITHMQKRGG